MRTYVRVGIALLSPFRIGGWLSHDDAANQTRTVRDHAEEDRPFVPSTGLVGSLRAHADDKAEELFGPPRGGELMASPWWALGVRLSDDLTIVQRGQTSINRGRRVAASRGYRTSDEVLPAETGRPDLYLYLSSDRPPATLLEVLATWRPTIGAGITSGLGDAEVVQVLYKTFETTSPADLLLLVQNGKAGPERIDALLAGADELELVKQPPALVLQATLRVEDLLVADRDDPAWRRASLFHGSAWKGILRSRVTYIARCLGLPCCPVPQGDDGTAEDWTGCGECPVCVVFGSAESGQGCWAFSCSEQVHDPETVRERHRTAIDRFTGGYRSGALFPEQTLPSHELTLTVHWARKPDLGEPDISWVPRALLRALGDLNDGIIGLGGRTGSGLGRVSVRELELGVEAEHGPDGEPICIIPGLPIGPADTPLINKLAVKEPADA